MRNKNYFFVLVALTLIFITGVSSCKSSSKNSSPLEGYLKSYGNCKAGSIRKESPPESSITRTITYQYDKNSRILLINHNDTLFNCCPGLITSEIIVTDLMITIDEKEREKGCDCHCRYNLNFEFLNVEPAIYRIVTKSSYIGIEIYTINLQKTTNGSIKPDSQ